MRTFVSVAGVLAAAALAAGCASRSPCPTDPCAPCPTACAPKPVWIPPRMQVKACYEVVPPRTRDKTVADLGLCRQLEHVPVTLPVRQKVTVEDTADALAPVYQPTCVPEVGYTEVQDYRDRLCPRYECRCVAKPCTVTTVTCGIECGRCGPKPIATVTKRPGTYGVVEPVAVGERLTSVPCGTHLEQTQVGCHCVPIHVGARRTTCVTGAHLEDRIVGSREECTEVDHGVRVRERGAHRVPVETQPWRYQMVERRCWVPGFWATVVETAPAVREPGVITRAEYEELMKDVARSH